MGEGFEMKTMDGREVRTLGAEQATEITDIGHIDPAVGAIQDMTERLEKELTLLREKLSPVLRPSDDSMADNGTPEPVQSPLASSLASLRDRLWRVSMEFAEVRHRLDF